MRLTQEVIDKIQLAMSLPNRAGLIIPVGINTDKEEIIMLVMPVMLND